MSLVCPACESTRGHRFVESHGSYKVFRCAGCTVEFAWPMDSTLDKGSIARVYESRTEFVGQYIGWFHREFLKHMPSPPGALLDVGCGTGDFVELASRNGYKATGIDPDQTAIESGKAFHGDVPLFCTTAADFFRRNDSRHDVITFFEVLEHLENPQGFLQEVRRHLVYRGHIALSVPNNDSPMIRLYRKATRVIDYPPHHLTRWSKKALRRLLEAGGFEIVQMVSLEPSVTDIIPDACRIRLSMLRPMGRARVAAFLRILANPMDRLVSIAVKEGRGMFVLARATS